jgi:hypothetical protein
VPASGRVFGGAFYKDHDEVSVFAVLLAKDSAHPLDHLTARLAGGEDDAHFGGWDIDSLIENPRRRKRFECSRPKHP